MSRSFRHSESFAETRAAFAERKQARERRAAAFEALGFDDAEALAARPMGRYRGPERSRGSVLDITV